MAKKLIKFMNTAFRDGFQSCYGARVFTDDFMPAVKAAAEAGITWFEAGGGARFQAPYFYGNEDAFKMMDAFRAQAGPDADLQTLSRGVNVVGLDSQPRDIIKLHAVLFKKHGITTIRNFDALNDVNNLIDSGQAIHDAGLKHQICVTMMALPPECSGAHDPDFYEKTLRAILDANIPFDSVCFKDASGTSFPATIYETIKRARKMLGAKVLIDFHSHETAGVGVVGYKAAIEAGADAIDLSMAPVSGGTCSVDILTMWHALRGSDYDLGIDPNKIRKAEAVFKKCMAAYPSNPEALAVEPLIPWSPMPGGALTANTEMLRDNGLMDKYDECLLAMNEVVVKGGFGTSVTPVSQFYFQQAFNNVMHGPWKKIAEGYGKMVLGYFGKTPVAPDAEVVKIAEEQLKLKPTTEKVVEINERDPKKGVAAAKKMLTDAGIADLSDENIFIASCCKEKGILFLQGKAKPNIRKVDPNAKKAAGGGDGAYAVRVGDKTFNVNIVGNAATVNGKSYNIDVQTGTAAGAAPAPAPAPASGAGAEVKSPLPGLVIRISVSEGAAVQAGDELLVLEAMKMETPIKALRAGVARGIAVKPGDQIVTGQTLLTL
ncbi:MAG: biotin attachment protein [Planctomycetota bacterium]|nr:biotin attachment protein [Planctomycetota bacterium]